MTEKLLQLQRNVAKHVRPYLSVVVIGVVSAIMSMLLVRAVLHEIFSPGTTNTVAKFTSASTVGNSDLTDDGTNVTVTSEQLITSTKGIQVNTFSGTAATPVLRSFVGDPNGTVTGAKGSLVMDTSTPALWQNSTGGTVWTKAAPTALSGAGCPWCSNAFDATCTFDGIANPVCGATLSGSTYTEQRDISAATASVSTGVTINENGFRFFVKDTLTGAGTAHIMNDGGSAVGITGGVSPRNGTGFIALATLAGGNGGGTGLGQAGGGGSPSGSAPTEWPTAAGHLNGVSGVSTGDCGAGGTGQGNGGASGSVTTLTASHGASTITALLTGRNEGTNPQSYTSGCSGGGGGSSVGTCVAGGGGAGGGWTIVAFHDLSGAITISADGGNGANATAGTNNCGGGGGGGGGMVVVIYSTTIGATMTTHASLGTGGTPTNAGVAGGNGFAGSVFKFNLSGDGT